LLHILSRYVATDLAMSYQQRREVNHEQGKCSGIPALCVLKRSNFIVLWF
jgi:hypothetical protein